MSSNGGDLSTESLSFTQSSLFEPGQKNMDSIELGFGASFLFGGSDQLLSRQEEPPATQETPNNYNEIGSTEASNATDYSPEIDYSPASYKTKHVKLFSGNVISLKPKTKSRLNNSAIQELESNRGDYLDMDALFSKAKLRSSIKANNEKLQQLSEKPARSSKSNSNQIWTEKYRPNSYIQLCSAGNDRLYRTVLHWLKKWSPVVFGEEKDESGKGLTDSLGRPHRKILLVHGPSGIGKTVAIHILAKQLGYNVEELNASNSMDTLPQGSNTPGSGNGTSVALKLKIMNALTSNKINSDGKPSCLVIDEIDSAFNSNDIIRVLNDLVNSDLRSMYRKKSGVDDPKKPKKKPFVLNRPIICIANDIYTNNSTRSNGSGGSPMDKLRQISEIVPFRKPSVTKGLTKLSGNALRSVKNHLMEISSKEKLSLDYQKISEIVETCEGDIRASMNHLQFNGRKIKNTEGSTTSKHSSLKDSQMSWFSMVDMLFKREAGLSKDENFDMLLDMFMNGNGRSVASGSGSFDKVIRGCFNQYLDVVRFQDDSLVKPSIFSDWLNYYDSFGSIGSGGEHEVGLYISLVGLKVWSLFSEINRQKVSRETSLIPNSGNLDFETFESIKRNKSIIKTMADKIPIRMKLSLGDNPELYAGYILPYFSRMLTPELSSKVKSNLTENEKSIIERITELIKDLDWGLENERDLESGTVTLQLSPSWDLIVYYDNQYAPVSFAGKQKQIQQRRQTLFPLITSELKRLAMTRMTDHKRPVQVEPEGVQESIQKLKRIKVSSIDFFKERYDGLASQISETKLTVNNETTRIWVKYNEGFSNAVRKNIGWDDIWAP